jgi:flavin-dependent dehydrogenase
MAIPHFDNLKRNGAFIVRPVSTSQILLGQDNLALIGEAAGWISPTSAEGLSYAFRSALALAKSLEENSAHFLQAYARNSRSLFMNIRLKNLKAPFMYNPFLRKAAMKSGLLSMNIYHYL